VPDCSLVIAAAQSASVAGNVARNTEHHVRVAEAAADHGVQLLVFPELSLIGYELDLARANVIEPESSVLNPLRDVARGARMTIVAGAPVRNDGDQLYIAALVFRPDGSVLVHTKEHVHESEQHVFACGPGGPLLLVEDTSVALAICADASHPSHAANAADRGAGVYAASAMITPDAYDRKAALLQKYARAHGIAVLLANYSGSTGGEASAGGSAIWSDGGNVVAASRDTEESLVIGRREAGVWRGTVLSGVV
jgi:predicted amidohydrolase